jgi:hypothetical protein
LRSDADLTFHLTFNALEQSRSVDSSDMLPDTSRERRRMNWRPNLGSQWPGAEPLSGRAVLAFAIVTLGIFWFSFFRNQDCLMFGSDGAWYRTMFAYEAVNQLAYSQTGVDALSGNFDAWYPLSPGFLLPHALAMLVGATVPGKTFIYLVFGAFLAFCIYILARTVRTGAAIGLTAGLSMPILAGAGLINRLAQFYPLFQVNPYWFESTGLGCLIVAAFWAMDGKDGWLRTALLVVAPTLGVVIATLALAPHVLFMVPIVGVYAAGSFLTVRRFADLLPRIAAGLLITVAAASLGVLTYYYGLIGYAAFRFFPDEIHHEMMYGDWIPLSTMFWTAFATSHIGAWVISLGIVGALWSVFAGSGRIRALAITHLIATILFLAIAYWLMFFTTTYRGSYPVYFETGIWPFALIFSAITVASALRLLLSAISAALMGLTRLLEGPVNAARSLLASIGRAVGWLSGRSAALVLLAVIAAIVFHNLAAIPPVSQCLGTGFSPIRPTAVTELLRQEIALRPGEPFRGMVATIDAVEAGKPGDWFEFHNHDLSLWRETGNDHRTSGLWYFDIPTLFQYHTFTTPPYYLLLTDFLSDPTDLQFRSVIVMTRIDPAFMALWGVRFVITDNDAQSGREVARLPTDHLGTLRVIELPHPNLGDYSPVEVAHADDFAAALRVMHQADFDGRRIVVTEQRFDPTLVPAHDVELIYTKEGLHLKAESAGQSVLVLPAQYSHCWTAGGTGEPRLFRANAAQLGVNFSGKLDVNLVFRFGPILAGTCRVEDLHDMERLRVSQARAVPREHAPH